MTPTQTFLFFVKWNMIKYSISNYYLCTYRFIIHISNIQSTTLNNLIWFTNVNKLFPLWQWIKFPVWTSVNIVNLMNPGWNGPTPGPRPPGQQAVGRLRGPYNTGQPSSEPFDNGRLTAKTKIWLIFPKTERFLHKLCHKSPIFVSFIIISRIFVLRSWEIHI